MRTQPLQFRPRLENLEERTTPSIFTVNMTQDVVNPTDGRLSLREAITKSNSHAGADTIVVPAGTFKIGILGTGEGYNAIGDFDIFDTVTVHGAGRGLTFIDGQQLDRVFEMLSFGPNPIQVVLQGLTIRNGKDNGNGGGINIGRVNLVVRDCAITGNRATGDGVSGHGGGISNFEVPGVGSVKLVRTLVSENQADQEGGGIYVGGEGSVLTVRDSAIRNSFSNGLGGGLYAREAMLINSTVSGNTANSSGGGIFARSVTLTNSTVTGNLARNNTFGVGGGGIAATNAILTNCTISGNSTISIGIANGGGVAGNQVTLTNCNVNENKSDGTGGGISASTAILTNCTVTGNEVQQHGGGISANNTVTITGGTISYNSATINGGGIYAVTATLVNATVSDNSAGDNGGGIFATTATLTRSRVNRNSVGSLGTPGGSSGGGIFADTLTLTRGIVSGNTAENSGGGIIASTATLSGSILSGNTAMYGGGITAAGTATMTNSTFSGNTAKLLGGGIFGGMVSLLNCTVAKNIAHEGGGIYHGRDTFSLRNTIVALNVVDFGGSGPDVAGNPFTTLGHNLIGNGDGVTGFGTNFDIVGTSVKPIDPKLGPLQNNGGPTLTHRLLAGSPAIDHGDNAALPPTDQRGVGFARKKDGNADGRVVVDIGAFER